MRSSGWISKVLDEVVDIFGGGTPKTSASEYWGGDIPWLSVKDFNDDTRVVYHTEKSITSLGLMNSAARVLDEGDVVISARGTVGEVTQLGRPMAFNQSCYGLRGKRGQLDNTYLYYLLRHKVRDFNQRSHGSVFSTITRDTFRGIHVLLPEVDEQTAIAATLSCLDDKIELNNRMNKTLEEMAQALFKSWFVDFDPVKAKMEGREPAGMDAETAALFPDEFEESELGPIPKGWRTGRLGEVVASIRQAASLAEIGDDCPYVGLEHIPRKSLMLESWGQASEISSQKSSFRAGNILFGKLRPYFHKVSIAPVDGICSTDILAFSASEEWYGFAVGHLYSTDLIDYATNLSQGTRMPRVNLKDISNYPVVLPGLGIASAYSNVAASWFAHMLANARQNSRLSALRDTLLPRLMSGEIRVPQAEEIMEEVL